MSAIFPYDAHIEGELSLRGSVAEVSQRLGQEIQERLSSAGVELIEAGDDCDYIVFEGNRRQIGNFLPIIIYDANAHTLKATLAVTEGCVCSAVITSSSGIF